MLNFEFGLGDELQCVITGFRGVVRARVEYLTGCNRYGLQNTKLKSGSKPEDWVYFDEMELKLVKTQKIILGMDEKPLSPRDTGRTKGGPLMPHQIPPQ